jgi:integrase
MFARRVPDSEWLFPSPRRGDEDLAAKTFRESLILAREAAGMPKFGFHDCRHHFISMCVIYRERKLLARVICSALKLENSNRGVIVDIIRDECKCYAGLMHV